MRIQKQRKKGELTMETVVLAALALIFLIVVLFFLTQKTSIFSKGLADCENKEGACMSEADCTTQRGTQSGFSCPNEGDTCCLNTCQGKGGECTTDNTCGEKKEIYLASCPFGEICCSKR